MTENKKTRVTTFEGIDIYVSEVGIFSATPLGCRKERESYRLAVIKDEIRMAADKAKQKKRPDAATGMLVFDARTGTVDVNAQYVGVRAKAGQYGDSGHVFQIHGVKRTRSAPLHVVRPEAGQDAIADLEHAHEVVKAAEKDYQEQLRKTTAQLDIPLFSGYYARALDLVRIQDKVVSRIKKIQQKDPTTV